MNKRLLGLALVVVFFGTVLAGCGCMQQAVKGEAPPPPAPAAVAPPASASASGSCVSASGGVPA